MANTRIRKGQLDATLVTTADKLSALAATTSAELITVISDETGSGALVFATSPTLVTPTLGVATATRLGIGAAADATRVLYVTGDVSGGNALVERVNATTNAVVGTMIIQGTSTGTAADGFGSAFQFAIKDNVGGPNNVADIRGIRSGALNSGKMTFSTSNASTMTEAMAISNTQIVTLTNAGTVAGSVATIDGTQTFTNKTLTSPTLVTPILGVAAATTINKVTITAPATNATLTLAQGSSLITAGAFALTLTSGQATNVTVPTVASLTMARIDAAQTFTGIQTMTSPAQTTSVTTGSTSFTAWAGATTLLTLGGTGASASVFLPSTLDATSSTTGASRTSGGMSAAKALWVGTTANVAGISTLNGIALATGNIVLAENTSVQLDPAGSADGKYTGITMTATGGAVIAFGDLLYLDSATSRWKLADADAATTGDRMLAMAATSSTDGAAITLLLQGNIRADAKFPALTIGSAVYVGETAGAIQVTIPTGADNVIRRVGYALTADEIYFNPSQDSQISVA